MVHFAPNSLLILRCRKLFSTSTGIIYWGSHPPDFCNNKISCPVYLLLNYSGTTFIFCLFRDIKTLLCMSFTTKGKITASYDLQSILASYIVKRRTHVLHEILLHQKNLGCLNVKFMTIIKVGGKVSRCT